MTTHEALIHQARVTFHKRLIEGGILSISDCNKSRTGKSASNADSSQKFSATISHELAKMIANGAGVELDPMGKKLSGQTLGNKFEEICADYLSESFLAMSHLRPGRWIIQKVGGRSEDQVSRYAQYSHLAELKRLADDHDSLATFLGNGYTIAPDVIIAREPEPDDVLNSGATPLVDDQVCLMATLRESNHQGSVEAILHASVSCKYTMRSDRAQNTRTEALNLLRNRKGRTPHIVSVTAEPTPTRLASLALGTGDVDCVYHFALHELKAVLEQAGDWGEVALDQLNIMIEGKRLRDISDLPLDLAI